MSESVFALPEPKTDAEYEAAIDLLLKEMLRHEEQMDRNRAEIERLKAETQVIADHTDTVISGIWKQLDSLRKAN
jgi:hypothetical protein